MFSSLTFEFAHQRHRSYVSVLDTQGQTGSRHHLQRPGDAEIIQNLMYFFVNVSLFLINKEKTHLIIVLRRLKFFMRFFNFGAYVLLGEK